MRRHRLTVRTQTHAHLPSIDDGNSQAALFKKKLTTHSYYNARKVLRLYVHKQGKISGYDMQPD